ncbi:MULTISPECIES: acetamidase/formamidase family protein [Halomonadaceae]|uniref:acetamidase/formamidase family protein n=1 Tax=Halomonadaceae TaxID=28256 RepID=UPI00200DB4BC|nr:MULTISPECIES: acetamidase/formamidase family protein [Halomonas]
MAHPMPIKSVHGQHCHHGWSNANSPAEIVAPGATLTFECQDAAGGYFTRASSAADVDAMPFERLNPVTGPIFIDGAQPGDVLKITINEFRPSGFGWTAIIPGFGLLADQFTSPGLFLWDYDTTSRTPAAYGGQARIPRKLSLAQ